MDLSAHTSLTPLAEAIGAVQSAAREAAFEIFLAGALARDLWLEFAYQIDTGRMTSDVDFAVECADWSAFERLRAALVASGELVEVGRFKHKFRHGNGTELDLIPYGGIERADRTLAWPPEEDPVMNALGYSEVASTTVHFLLPAGVTVPVVELRALALLKLVAWSDRHHASSGKDAHDLFVIAKNYLDSGQSDRFFETCLDISERADFDYEAAGAEMLGRDMAPLCRGALGTFLTNLLARETEPGGNRLLVYQMSQMARDEERALGLLVALQRGLAFGLDYQLGDRSGGW